jgi:tetratricopeptide (TPR) repeat protein
MDQLADALDDDRRRAHVALRRSYLALRTGDRATQEAAARRGALLAERSGDDELRLRCVRAVTSAVVFRGDWREGERIAQEALAQARALGLRKVESNCLNDLVVIAANSLGDSVAALEPAEQCLAINRELGDKANEAIALGNLGSLWLDLGDFAQAGRYLEESLRLVRSNGDRAIEAVTLRKLCSLALWQGEDARALTLARSAKGIAAAVEAREIEARSLLGLGSAELALGRLHEAKEAFEQAREMALATELGIRHEAIAGLARVAMARNDLAAGLQEVEQLIAHLDSDGTFEGIEHPSLLELTCYQVLERAGDKRANEWLERSHSHLHAFAVKISDVKIRNGFLNNIPEHREIVALWSVNHG